MSPTEEKPYKVGLALSGGGARGIAHIGVIKALLEHEIQVDVIAGTSAGSIIGTLFAAGKSPEEMKTFVESASLIRSLFPARPNKGLLNLHYLNKQLSKHIKEDSFDALKIPLHVNMTKLSTGETVVRHSGMLFEIVCASCAIPLVFQPVIIEEETYVDGGLLLNLPTSVIRDQCDVLIGVNLIPFREVPEKKIKSVKSVLERCFDLTIINHSQLEREICDVLIEPEAVSDYHIFQFQKVEELIELGYQSGLKAIPTIKEKLELVKH
ncbi:MAG: patatin-like phospholipase family protein [Saprospiraceae bacterium]|nr:patatin-like phospholipase family protein [Saprospiraceae bacterium]